MLMPDVNILVYAHRRDEATHASCAAWLQDVIGDHHRAVSARRPGCATTTPCPAAARARRPS
jgi:hypothetical protein